MDVRRLAALRQFILDFNIAALYDSPIRRAGYLHLTAVICRSPNIDTDSHGQQTNRRQYCTYTSHRNPPLFIFIMKEM
jgi:hypothetical protein